jgi:hypothetical protein
MESRLDEERWQLSGAMKAFQTKNSHQPVWEGGIHREQALLYAVANDLFQVGMAQS